MKKALKSLLLTCALLASQMTYATDVESHISLKQPGNKAVTYTLTDRNGKLEASAPLPLTLTKTVSRHGEDEMITVTIRANEKVYFNFGGAVSTGFNTNDCDFYLPGFWYHKNLRSPKEAPSFHTSKSWNVREDRLSSPLSGAFNLKSGQGMTILRQLDEPAEALTTAQEGEVIVSGKTSIGYVGFDNESGVAKLTFGFPYVETPKRYIRKLTLAPSIEAFMKLEKGESRTLTWVVRKEQAADFSEFLANTWTSTFDRMQPKPIRTLYSAEEMKSTMSNYFRRSYVSKYPLKFNSGMTLRTDCCAPVGEVQLGFVGRVLLNAFNQIEYGEKNGQSDLVRQGQAIFDSYLEHGFTQNGYLRDFVNFDREGLNTQEVHSIRQQSEAVYAILHYLKYEKSKGRKHKSWETKTRALLDNLIKLQKTDGHFARKFNDDGSDVDASGGSTPSATSTLVMGYRYFGNKNYLKSAKRTVDYVEKNIIAPADYFSSTLDANCEDKEAAIAAVTSTYYLAMVTKGKERQHYIDLCRKATYFALSWYYLWDVPFAEGQMLGDLGFHSRGWGNVSVENNHIDVFVFEFPHIMKWLGAQVNEPRFGRMYDVIYSSLSQLLPTANRMCGIGMEGFYPEVVQHTAWDYGRNGKGFYNDIFAPGWTVASLWELYSPTRTSDFLLKK
jgi:hypothetical protein